MTNLDLAKRGLTVARMPIDSESYALVSAMSKRTGIPVQDLVGAACQVAINLDDGGRKKWLKTANTLREQRIKATTK